MVDNKIKLQRLLRDANFGSRREVDDLIASGKVLIGGKPANLGAYVTLKDKVTVDGKKITVRTPMETVTKVIIYNKPTGQVSTRSDEQDRPTVYDNLPEVDGKVLINIGRLDINTSGLMLFTNNGELANRLMHPKYEIQREYLVRVLGEMNFEKQRLLTSGKLMLDGESAAFGSIRRHKTKVSSANNWYKTTLRSGKFREVRNLFKEVDCRVSRLIRITYGTVSLPKTLKQGEFEELEQKGVNKLLYMVGLGNEAQS